MTRSAEDRLARALDRVQAGSPSAFSVEDDAEVLELLETAGYLRENLTRVPAPGTRSAASFETGSPSLGGHPGGGG